MSHPKNYHLLLRVYWSSFCNKEIHETENHDMDRSCCRVWVHDKEREEIRERGVKKLSPSPLTVIIGPISVAYQRASESFCGV